MCSETQEAHDYAVACMYGLLDEKHYLKNTTSTDSVLSYADKASIDKVLQTLVHVARKTGRAIRIKMPILPGYNSEHKQPYSLVDAAYLSDFGVSLVEPQFWTKAHGPRGHLPVFKHIELGEDPIGNLSKIDSWENDDADELVFSLDELLNIDSAVLGKLVGEKGGFINNKWARSFLCEGDPAPDAHKVIPQKNDPMLFASGNYFLYPS